ncbi:bacteriocin [Legionella sp. W05-934-2]|jgi:bacteriocin-like protein|uniref:bacteriocin n=1 Tax=Legionella sp. W05-934-2 TaxID=1198649 RepID=UPI0034626055
MQEQPRVLGYLNAKEITNEALSQISGGLNKMTVTPTQRITGVISSPDIEFDQNWD